MRLAHQLSALVHRPIALQAQAQPSREPGEKVRASGIRWTRWRGHGIEKTCDVGDLMRGAAAQCIEDRKEPGEKVRAYRVFPIYRRQILQRRSTGIIDLHLLQYR